MMTNNEPFRPQFHFTPPAKWINDPNGLVFYKGEYHLFYQYYPNDTVWGPMHWGHAVSHDLVNWTHLPIALYPDEQGYIYSGSAVIDGGDTAVATSEAMVAIFTHHNPQNDKQSQSIAHSLDQGRTWTKYAGNPVIDTPDGLPDFRDPKVFWYANGQNGGHWVMVVAAGDEIYFYTSPDLMAWQLSSRFGSGHGSTAGVWETPDLFLLIVDGNPSESRWVLTVGVWEGAPAGGSGTQYFVGTFDGRVFTNENPKEVVLWADWGADFYAAQSWSNEPNGRRIWLAWFNNWQYAPTIPTSTWRGAMSLPRAVGLARTPEGIRLVQKPVVELAQLRNEQQRWTAVTINHGTPFSPHIQGDLLEIIAEFQVGSSVDGLQLHIHLGTDDESITTIGYAAQNHTLFIDRTRSGQVDFHAGFPGRHTAVMPPIGGVIRLHMFVDRSSIELFGNDGLVCMSERIFPAQRPYHLEFVAVGGTIVMNTLDVYRLKAANFQMEKRGNRDTETTR